MGRKGKVIQPRYANSLRWSLQGRTRPAIVIRATTVGFIYYVLDLACLERSCFNKLALNWNLIERSARRSYVSCIL